MDSSTRRLLFLDFDGVMHPAGCTVDTFFCHLDLLESWLQSRTAIDVVISSSWREVNSLDEMQSFFSEDVQRRVIGVTPITGRRGQMLLTLPEREDEVCSWLNSNAAEGACWAALDDQPWLFSPNQPRLVVCDGTVGLTEHELRQLDEIFEEVV